MRGLLGPNPEPAAIRLLLGGYLLLLIQAGLVLVALARGSVTSVDALQLAVLLLALISGACLAAALAGQPSSRPSNRAIRRHRPRQPARQTDIEATYDER